MGGKQGNLGPEDSNGRKDSCPRRYPPKSVTEH